MRDKLIDLIQNAVGGCARHWAELIADHLIANGVTFAECLVDTNKTSADVPDTNVGKWIPVSEMLPIPFVSVLVQMPDEEPCPTVREGYLTNKGTWYTWFFERGQSEVTHWMPMPEPPKEVEK